VLPQVDAFFETRKQRHQKPGIGAPFLASLSGLSEGGEGAGGAGGGEVPVPDPLKFTKVTWIAWVLATA
jgi:hypothetical protein